MPGRLTQRAIELFLGASFILKNSLIILNMIVTHINISYYILTKHTPISTSYNLFCKMPAALFTMPLDIKGNETERNLKREKAVLIPNHY